MKITTKFWSIKETISREKRCKKLTIALYSHQTWFRPGVRLTRSNLAAPLGVKSWVFIRMILRGKRRRIWWFAISPPGASSWVWKRDISIKNQNNSKYQFLTLRKIRKILAIGSWNFGSLNEITSCINYQHMYLNDHPWQGKFPIPRCTLEELSTYLRSLVPDTEMQINLPCALSGRNKGYAFVKLNEGLSLLVRALWKSSIPTRKSTRLVKLQPANVNFAWFSCSEQRIPSESVCLNAGLGVLSSDQTALTWRYAGWSSLKKFLNTPIKNCSSIQIP